MNFVYVFSKEDMITMLRCGYTLIRSDEKENVYIFDNKALTPGFTSDTDNKSVLMPTNHVFSNTMIF